MSQERIPPELERWPGYHEQSWQQRYQMLDAQYRDLQRRHTDFLMSYRQFAYRSERTPPSEVTP